MRRRRRGCPFAPGAAVSFRLPPGARFNPKESGQSSLAGGVYFRYQLPSGYTVYFSESDPSNPVDIADTKKSYQDPRWKAEKFLYSAPDAIVVRRRDPAPMGGYCEVTACGKFQGRAICVDWKGALWEEDGTVTKMTEEECLGTVAVARSIRAEP